MKGLSSLHTYIVQPGDSFRSIALKFSVSEDAIRSLNGLFGNVPATGTVLKIPVRILSFKLSSGQTPDSIAESLQLSQDTQVFKNGASGENLTLIFPQDMPIDNACD